MSTTKKTATEIYKAYLERDGLVSGGSVAPNWTADGSGLWFVEGAPENTVVTRVDLLDGNSAPVFDVTAVRDQLAVACGHEPPYDGLPFTSFRPAKNGWIEFDYNDTQWRLNPVTSHLEPMASSAIFNRSLRWTSEAEPTPKMWKRYDYISITFDVPEQLSPSGEWFASIRNNDIALRSTSARDGKEQSLTFSGTPDCFWDIEAPRMKVMSGRRFTFRSISSWSPDSSTLLAYRRDITGVFRMPRVHWLSPFENVERLPYQKAGAKLDRVEPVFVDVRSGRQTPVALEQIENRYVQLLTWHPDGTEALIVVYTRDFKRVDIVSAHRETGAIRRLLTETSATFVKIQHDAIMFAGDHGFHMLPNGQGFLWLSTRDGWNHLYHYDMNGKLIGQLTCGHWPVYEVSHIGCDGFVYFTAAINTMRPYDVHVCRTPLHGGQIEQLTHEKGIHMPTFAPNGQVFLDLHSAVDRPTRTDLLRADGTRIRVLSEMDISRLEAVGYRPAEEFTVKAADGTTDLWGVMYKPFDFDPSQSYPVIEYIYGGPQTIETPRFFAVDKTMMESMKIPWALAHLGYIVVCLDARGTPGRSKAFHDVVHGNWNAGVPDHAAAIRQLCDRHSWMDANRVGIVGHSWGGYFSTCALIQAPDTYHAAVAYAPHYDPWDMILYEPYLDLPGKNRHAYEQADLIRQATKVVAPLMIVVGSSDYNMLGSAMKMTWALIKAKVEHEFVIVPGAFHHFAHEEQDYLMIKLTGWFDRYVKHR